MFRRALRASSPPDLHCSSSAKAIVQEHSKQYYHIRYAVYHTSEHLQLTGFSFNCPCSDNKADKTGTIMTSPQPENQYFSSSTTMSAFPTSQQLLLVRLVPNLRPGKVAKSISRENLTQTLTFALSTTPQSLEQDAASNKKARITDPTLKPSHISEFTAMAFYDEKAPSHLQNNWPTTMGRGVSRQTFSGFEELPTNCRSNSGNIRSLICQTHAARV